MSKSGSGIGLVNTPTKEKSLIRLERKSITVGFFAEEAGLASVEEPESLAVERESLLPPQISKDFVWFGSNRATVSYSSSSYGPRSIPSPCGRTTDSMSVEGAKSMVPASIICSAVSRG